MHEQRLTQVQINQSINASAGHKCKRSEGVRPQPQQKLLATLGKPCTISLSRQRKEEKNTSTKGSSELGHLGVLSHDAAMKNVQLFKTRPLHHRPSHRLPATILPSLDLTFHVTKQGRRCCLHSQKNSPFIRNHCLTDSETSSMSFQMTPCANIGGSLMFAYLPERYLSKQVCLQVTLDFSIMLLVIACNPRSNCRVPAAFHLSEPRLIPLSKQLAGLLIDLQGLFLELAQPEALDVLLQLGYGIHGFDVAHCALLACSPAWQGEPRLEKGHFRTRSSANMWLSVFV